MYIYFIYMIALEFATTECGISKIYYWPHHPLAKRMEGLGKRVLWEEQDAQELDPLHWVQCGHWPL